MEKTCEICAYADSTKHQLLLTDYWKVSLGSNQAYFGRAFMSLRQHKGSLNELSTEEWADFQRLVPRIEVAYKQAFGAEPMNWSCLMNNAFQTEPDNPHVHWHIIPRYRTAPTLGGITFDDSLFGYHYDPKATREVSDDIIDQIEANHT